MKKMLCYLLIFSILLIGNTNIANAASVNHGETNHSETIEYLEDGSYFVTTIDTVTENPLISTLSTTSTCSGKKTVTYKSSSGDKLWSVTVTGSFSYVKGSSSKCTSSSVSTAVYSSSWKINKSSASKTGNKAIASATASKYLLFTAVSSITKEVTLTCSVNGTLS